MAATLTAIAREAGVSLTTVSRLFKGDKSLRISNEKRQRIFTVKEQMGGVRTVQTMPVAITNIIAPVSRIFSNDWVHVNLLNGFLMKGLERTLLEHEFRFSVTFFDEENKQQIIEGWANSNYCGGFMLLTGVADKPLAEFLLDRSVPHVSVDYTADALGLNTVFANDFNGLHQAVEHLYQLGHRTIGYVGVREFHRYPMMIAALAGLRLPIAEDQHCWVRPITPGNNLDQWTKNAAEAFNEKLKGDLKATAFICQSDRVALGVLSAMQAKGMKPGRDLSIVGYDNMEERGINPVSEPILTTIDNPLELIGQRCGELIINQVLHRQTQIIHEWIPTQVIVRKTTGPCVG